MLRYITDPDEIGKGDSRALHSQFFLPILDREYDELTATFFGTYERALAKEAEDRSDVLLADYRFLFLVLHYVTGIIAEQRCQRNQVEVIASRQYVESINIDWTLAADWFYTHRVTENSLRMLAKDWYHSFLNNYRLLKEKRICRYDSALASAMGVQWDIKADYMAFERKFSLQKEPGRYFGNLGLARATPNVAEWVSTIDPVLEAVALTFPGECDHVRFDEIRKAWIRRLADVDALYCHLRKFSAKPSTLLVSGGTNPFRKITVLAFQREGVDTKVFHHGNDFGARITQNGHRGEVSHCRQFYCPTEAICATYRRSYQNTLTESRYGTEYFSVYQDGDKSYLPYKTGTKNKGKVDTVLILGRPLNFSRITDARLSHFVQKIELDRRLIQLFKAMKFTVKYKPHPEWSSVARRAMDNCDIDILEGSFEDHWDQADICLFSTVTSTTFGFAMSTNIPVILLNAVGNEWDQEARMLVEKRCAVINVTSDDVGRAVVTQAELADAVTDSVEKSDNTLLYKNVFLGDESKQY